MADKLAATFHGAPLTDTLRPILEAYRQEVQPHWSPASAHPAFDGKQGDPAGQCGVTSAWAQRRLREDHGVETVFCVGVMQCLYHDKRLDDHCWLEIGEGDDRLIIDLTSDQIGCGFSAWVMNDAVLHAEDHCYVADIHLVARDLADPVQARLAILTAEVGR